MDTTGAVNRYLYEPYCQQIRSWTDTTPAANTSTGTALPDGSETGASTTIAGDVNPWRYESGYYDTETGLLKYGIRYYVPKSARHKQTLSRETRNNRPRVPLPFRKRRSDRSD